MQYHRSFAIAALMLLPALPVRAQAQESQPAVPPAATASNNVARLQNFGTLVSFLNLASGTVRVVVVVSPASPVCKTMLETVSAVLEANPSKRLRAYVVMTRQGPEDSAIRALSYVHAFHDRRIVYLWDEGALAADAFRSAVGSKTEPATGVCMLYDTDARLALSPPAPSFWMSANPRIPGPALDAKELGGRAGEMVRRVEAKASEAARTPH